MTVLHISALAGRTGVPTSTLRYYERIGLLVPTSRATNGYRQYDSSVVERLAFIGRAKRLGMDLATIRALLEVWDAGSCGPVQDGLRAFLAKRVASLHDQIAADASFASELEQLLRRLEDAPATGGPCGADCGCTTTVLADPPAACSLTPADLDARLAEWRSVLGRASRTDRRDGTTVAVFESSADLAGELARLCVDETACCPDFRFTLQVSSAELVLTAAGR